MIAYLDSSVLLRILLREKKPFKDFSRFSKVYTSRLLKVEVLRVLQRELLLKNISESDFSSIFQEFTEAFKRLSVISLKERVFAFAESAYSRPLGTLDGLHLATAMILREALESEIIVFLTHDDQLASAALSVGFLVEGV